MCLTAKIRASRGGFTLVELLVVIAVVSVLIATLLPSMSQAKEHAWIVRCASNQHNIGIALATYGTDNKGMLPIRIEHNSQPTYAAAIANPIWVYGLTDWYRIYKGYLLPENALGPVSTTNFDSERNIYLLGLRQPIFSCPTADQSNISYNGPSNTNWIGANRRSTFGYLFNIYQSGTHGINVHFPPGSSAQNRLTRRLEEMPRNQMVLIDHLKGQTWYTGQSGPTASAPYTPSEMNGLKWNFLWSVGSATAPSATYAAGLHHLQGANVLFAGGEVRRAPAKLYYTNYPSYTAITDRINF